MKTGKYSEEEIKVITSSENKTIKELAKILDRPFSGLKKKMYDLHRDGIIKVYSRDYKLYTEKDKQFIIGNPKMSTNEMCKRLKRGRNSLIVKRRELTPYFEKRKKKVKAEPDGFTNVLALVKEKGFKNTHEAIAHYGGVQQFKQAIRQ